MGMDGQELPWRLDALEEHLSRGKSKMSTKNEMKSGTVMVEGNRVTLQYRRLLPCAPETVWKAITEPNEVSTWFSTTAKIDARPGGMLEYVSVPAGIRRYGRILV